MLFGSIVFHTLLNKKLTTTVENFMVVRLQYWYEKILTKLSKKFNIKRAKGSHC
jgi:hypothetical protein